MCATWMIRAGLVAGISCGLAAGPAGAADPVGSEPAAVYDPLGGGPRYFPRSDGSDIVLHRRAPPPRSAGCLPRRVPVPTNALDDPSYVGSTYGLSKPSYYGLTPPPGVDDPFGRPVLPYCR